MALRDLSLRAQYASQVAQLMPSKERGRGRRQPIYVATSLSPDESEALSQTDSPPSK